MTAHPKVDPVTGELVPRGLARTVAALRCRRCAGRAARRFRSPNAPSMMHDLAITETRSLADLNVGYDFATLHGCARWHDDRPARIGAPAPRRRGALVRRRAVLHLARRTRTTATRRRARCGAIRRSCGSIAGRFADNPVGELWRYVIDTANGLIDEGPLADGGIEMPRINESRTGAATATCMRSSSRTLEMRGVMRFDHASGTTTHYAVPPATRTASRAWRPRRRERGRRLAAGDGLPRGD